MYESINHLTHLTHLTNVSRDSVIPLTRVLRMLHFLDLTICGTVLQYLPVLAFSNECLPFRGLAQHPAVLNLCLGIPAPLNHRYVAGNVAGNVVGNVVGNGCISNTFSNLLRLICMLFQGRYVVQTLPHSLVGRLGVN